MYPLCLFAGLTENTAKAKIREPDFQPKTTFYPVFVWIRLSDKIFVLSDKFMDDATGRKR